MYDLGKMEETMPLNQNKELVVIRIFLPAELRRRLKEYAARNDTTMNSLVVKLIKKLLDETEDDSVEE